MAMMTGTDAEALERGRGTGRWIEPGVPHRGWTCATVEDLRFDDPDCELAICEMCQVREIRYVHRMTHPDYPDELGVGIICAGHLEQDYAAAVERERLVRNASAQRARWLSREWRCSSRGNEYLKTRDGFHVVVFRKCHGWSGCVEYLETGVKVFARRAYPTSERAKLAAFDAMVILRKQIDEA
jgi:hypothetical protein